MTDCNATAIDANRNRARRMLRYPETLADHLDGVAETINTYGDTQSGRTIIMNELKQLAKAMRPAPIQR